MCSICRNKNCQYSFAQDKWKAPEKPVEPEPEMGFGGIIDWLADYDKQCLELLQQPVVTLDSGRAELLRNFLILQEESPWMKQ